MTIFKNLMADFGHAPFIIAEVSGNHGGDLETAKELIYAAKAAGASAVKFQTYDPNRITLDVDTSNFTIGERSSPWFGRTLYDVYSEGMTPLQWFSELFDLASSLGLIAFSSPFDESSVDFLESLNCPMYKVASFEITHIPLLGKIGSTGKPVIVSTGMASEDEISEALKTLRESGSGEIALLKCTSAYPAPSSDANLRVLRILKEAFNCPVGLSDHTLDETAALVSIGFGAHIFEKHLMLSTNSSVVDSAFSASAAQFKHYVNKIHTAFATLGCEDIGPSASEILSMRYRRSIYVSQDVSAGEVISEDNIAVVRPTGGLPPSSWSKILGLKFMDNYKKGTAVTYEMLG
jgi:pseudaminic acid synthase